MKSINQSKEKPLADAIRAAMKMKGMTVQEAATAIKVSHVHMTSLLNGARRLSGLSPDRLNTLSTLTGIRKSEMFVLCGLLTPEEFYPSGQPERIKQRLLQLQSDPDLRMYLHDANIDKASNQLKLLLAVLYEKAISGSLRINSTLVEDHDVAI